MPYRITLDGKDYNTDDLTLDEAIAVEKVTGNSWSVVVPLRSATDCKAVMRAFLLRDRTPEEADAFLSKLSAGKALRAVEVVPDDLPDEYEGGFPKAEGESETTT